MAATTWSLTEQERASTVERITTNILNLAFFKGKEINDQDARAAATAIEKKAYTAAQVAARTTTGERPAAETTSSYARQAPGINGHSANLKDRGCAR